MDLLMMMFAGAVACPCDQCGDEAVCFVAYFAGEDEPVPVCLDCMHTWCEFAMDLALEGEG